MKALTCLGPGKVNLLLDVLRRRPDGYHDIHSLMIKVGLCDRLRVADAPAGTVAIACDDPAVPTDERNLAHTAVALMRRESGLDRGCSVDIQKRIPVAGGMGGGSGNAATVMVALNRLWGLDWSRSHLQDLAQEIGADVPFFFGTSTSIVSGTGAACRDVSLQWSGWFVLVSADVAVPTAEVYRRCGPVDRADTVARVERLLAARDAAGIAAGMSNDLEDAVFKVAPRVGDLREMLVAEGARAARVSGAGSTLMEPFDERSAAEAFAARLRSRAGAHRVWVVEAPQEDASPEE